MTSIKWGEYGNSEKYAIELLQGLGYEYIEGSKLSPLDAPSERTSFREVLLSYRLIAKIKEFNPWISDDNIKQVIRKLTISTLTSNLEKNQENWEFLTKPSTLVVEQDIGDGRGRRNHAVKIIEWDNINNNEFLVTSQFKINASSGNRIPDIVIFVNGLPLVMIECKSPLITNPLTQAISQVVEYQGTIPRLFYFNQIIIATAEQSARYGVMGDSFEHYKEWKDPYPLNLDALEGIIKKTGRKTTTPMPQDILVYGLLEKRNLLDLIRNFIIYENQRGKVLKKISRYQQFRAVNKTIQRILSVKKPEERGGTIWHTQGSGKSLTMLFTAIKLRREQKLNNPLLVFITDRIDLIGQLNGTFHACGFPNPKIPKNAEALQQAIKTGQGITIFTTIQKFRTKEEEKSDAEPTDESFPELNADKNIFILIDEAHRSQYKIFALRLHKSMPNACYIAYTGTPLAKNEKNQTISVGKGKTVKKFGSFIDVYDIRQSVEDKATVQILYENRLPDLRIEGDSIDEIFDRIFADKTQKEKEEIKKKYATKDAILGAEERIKKITLDIIKHYEEKIKPNGFKAQIVTETREIAVRYKKFLDEYSAPESVVIISANPKYDKDLQGMGVPFITEKAEQQKMIDRFKDPNDPLAFLIVCDMLITGFDAPFEQVMYLDKALKEHNLLQAIARVNRTNENKTYGLIVDYYGVSLNLRKALEIFDTPDVEGVMKPIDSELPRLEQRHRQVMSYIDRHDKTDLEGLVLALEREDVRANFYTDFRKFSQSLDIILPDPRAEPYIKDLKLLQNIINALRVRTRDEQLDIAGCGGKVKKLIDEYIRTAGIQQLIEPVPILSDKFQEALDDLKSEESKASEIEHAIKHEINVNFEDDPVFYSSLKERLENIIEMYLKERIDLAEKIKNLKALVADIKAKPDIAKQLGLNSAELAFFNLLKKDCNGIGIENEREIVKITYEVLEAIEPFVTLIDWQHKIDIIRQMRKGCKDIFSTKKLEQSRSNILAQEIVNLAKHHFAT